MASTKKSSAELDDTPRLYELVGLIAGSVSEKEAQKIAAETKKLVTAAAADITVEDLWPRRALAYPIKHETEGWYLILNFTAVPHALKGLNKTLRMESKLIRFLLVTMPSDYTYISLDQLQARVKEAKEGLAPGLEKPVRRAQNAKPVPAAAKTAPADVEVDTKKLDSALEHLDDTI